MTLAAMIILLAICATQAQDGGKPKILPPVPVVPAAKTNDDDKTLPPIPVTNTKKGVAEQTTTLEENGGLLPWSFVRNKIENMPVGTKAYISVETVKCDSKRRVYLDPDQLYGTQNEGRVIMIHKDSSGYHIILDNLDHQWICQELPSGVKWIPIKTVTSR